jgi:hypothetical protein
LNELHLSMEALGDAAVFGEEPHGDDFTHSNADVSLRRFAGLRVYAKVWGGLGCWLGFDLGGWFRGLRQSLALRQSLEGIVQV